MKSRQFLTCVDTNGFSPVTGGGQTVPAASAASGMAAKPLKRLSCSRRSNTGLKPGANEISQERETRPPQKKFSHTFCRQTALNMVYERG
jgi:hypothetical protein